MYGIGELFHAIVPHVVSSEVKTDERMLASLLYCPHDASNARRAYTSKLEVELHVVILTFQCANFLLGPVVV
jgi:hypothetical protein